MYPPTVPAKFKRVCLGMHAATVTPQTPTLMREDGLFPCSGFFAASRGIRTFRGTGGAQRPGPCSPRCKLLFLWIRKRDELCKDDLGVEAMAEVVGVVESVTGEVEVMFRLQ